MYVLWAKKIKCYVSGLCLFSGDSGTWSILTSSNTGDVLFLNCTEVPTSSYSDYVHICNHHLILEGYIAFLSGSPCRIINLTFCWIHVYFVSLFYYTLSLFCKLYLVRSNIIYFLACDLFSNSNLLGHFKVII